MSQPSQSPPPKTSSGGNLKYVLIGLLFLGATVGVLMLGRQEPPPVPAAPAPPPPEPPRANPLAEQDLVLEPEPEPEPEPTPEPVKRKPGLPKAGEWECSGDLAGATAVINENRTQIRSCYERRLKINNVLQGDVKLRLRIGPTGKVTATQTAGSLRDADVLSCMRQLAQTWTFAAPTGGNCAVLSVPFRFAPKSP